MERIRKILRRTNLRQALLYGAVALLLVLARPTPRLFLPGSSLILAGEVLRLWATGHLQKNRILTTSGPFAHVRNPLYLGTLLIGCGFVLASADPTGASRYVLWFGLPSFLAFYFCFYFPHKDRLEQDRLIRHFGTPAEEYAEAVPALFPRFRRFQTGAKAAWSFRLVLQNSEHLTALGILAGVGWLWTRMAP